MDYFWTAITDREDPDNPASRRRTPFSRLVYERISENYKRVFEQPDKTVALPMRYRECLLLTDMVSGMTDRFAVELCAELTELNKGAAE
jgi:dGTPase